MAKDTKKRKFKKEYLGGKNRLKDISGDKKRNFADTFLGDLLGFDKKIGIDKGNPGLLASLRGKRRELTTAKIVNIATKTEIKDAEKKINTAIRKIGKFNADGTVKGSGEEARPGARPKATAVAAAVVNPRRSPAASQRASVRRAVNPVESQRASVAAAAKLPRPKPAPAPVKKAKKTTTELQMKAADLRAYSKQLSKLLKDPKQKIRWGRLSNEDKEKIKKSVIRSGRSIFKALDTVSPRAITTSEIKITKPSPDDKNPNALKGTAFIKLLKASTQKSQIAFDNLSDGEKRAVKSLIREEGLSLPQAVSRIKNG